MNSNTIDLHAIFKGRVQGVGFRWTLLDYAEQFGLKGSVSNLKDGTVEVFAQGSRPSLEAFLETVKKDPGSAQIDSVHTEYKTSTSSYPDFRIVH